MYCYCKHMAKGFKSMFVQLVLARKRHRMQFCSKTTGTKGTSLLSISGGLPGKLWMAAQSWAIPLWGSCKVLQPQTQTGVHGYGSLRHRTGERVCLSGSPTFNG